MLIKKGFTLIEVLIALVVVSLVFFTCLLSLTEMTKNSEILKEKTIASIVASNVITEVRLGMIKSNSNSTQKNTISMADKTWYWSLDKKSTSEAHVSELTISVKNSNNEEIYSMKGYVSE